MRQYIVYTDNVWLHGRINHARTSAASLSGSDYLVVCEGTRTCSTFRSDYIGRRSRHEE
jgi:hypothetical protein